MSSLTRPLPPVGHHLRNLDPLPLTSSTITRPWRKRLRTSTTNTLLHPSDQMAPTLDQSTQCSFETVFTD